MTRLHELQKQAFAKFQGTVGKVTGLSDKTRFLRLEASAPQCVPADALGGKQDLVKHAKATILYENSGKHDWLQVGEMIQVGLAWRLVDAPAPGDGQDVAAGGPAVDPKVQELLDKLRDLDSRNAQVKSDVPGPNAQVMAYNLARADLLEEIQRVVKPEEREQWIKQVADCLGTAAQNSPADNKKAYERLVRLEEQLVKAMPGSALAGYVTFREMQADYAAKLAGSTNNFAKVQEDWLARLAKFVTDYPRGEDTPDALLQLGMVSEFVGKEIEAKKWYENLAKNFADNALAVKARGALRRLDLEGKPLELNGPMLQGGAFNVGQVQGKVVVVYYWASWNQQCLGDFAKLKLLLDANKDVQLVCVNLDNTAAEATAFLQRSPAPGVHLFVPGGLESPLATQYGVMVLPNLFLVGKDGKVISRTVQVNNLEEEVKKALK
jgi:thiol-disulfide isomerase/thioredoxin